MSAGGILFPLAYRREVREAVDFIARANGNNLAIAAYWQALIAVSYTHLTLPTTPYV